MSRSQFILGIALLVVSATLAFTISFKHEDTPDSSTAAASTPKNPSSSSSRQRRIRSTPNSNSTPRKDRTFYEVTVSDRAFEEVAAQVQEESRQKLEELTERYSLTTSQRRGIFPLIAARHPQFQEGLTINGSSFPPQASNSSLESAMYPLLDDDQQDDLEDDALAENEWWTEIISQLRDDLDQAISDGDIIPTTDPAPASDTPATGDGEVIENPDIDLDGLFK